MAWHVVFATKPKPQHIVPLLFSATIGGTLSTNQARYFSPKCNQANETTLLSGSSVSRAEAARRGMAKHAA